MKRAMMALLLGLVVLASASAPAGAETTFRNKTPNVIWTAHAYSSVWGASGCGWPDACNGSGIGTWRVHGYFVIGPGGHAHVHPLGWGNAMHDYYGEDEFGHVWSGGGNTFCIGNEAFDHCGGNCGVDPTSINIVFSTWRGTRCCGGFCPGDRTLNFVL
jgi:hypothetical protein